MRAVGVMDFAGGFACGVTQAGFDYVAKREPSAFDGFGVTAIEANFQGVQVEVNEPEFWSAVKADLVFGCPPCSGFSMLSTINTATSKTGKVGADGVRVSQRGLDSPDNKWMTELVGYAARVKPDVVVMESVQSGGKLGQPLMRQLWQKIRDETGVDYHMTDLFMNASLVGGDVIRPRYFLVLHTRPFGVDLPRSTARTFMEVVGDLPLDAPTRRDSGYDPAWGHVTNGSSSDERIRLTIEEFRKEGYDWEEGKRLPVHLERWANEMGNGYPEWWYGPNGNLLSHAVSDNMYSPFRWRANQPMGVVTGGVLDRAVHPVAARPFTYREAARFMGLPDDWSLMPIVARKRDSWLGKAIPVASGRWVATWAKASIEGEPGEYAGVVVEPKHRVIDVTTAQRVGQVERGHDEDPIWWGRPDRPTIIYSDSRIGIGSGDRVSAELTLQVDETMPGRPRRDPPPPRPRRPRTAGEATKAKSRLVAEPIVRIAPEVFSQAVADLGLTAQDAADAMGVSRSRIAELVGQHRPKSWLNAARWADVQGQLRAHAATLGR